MEITSEFRVDAPIDRAWSVLTDLAGIAPCLPGAQLTGIDGDKFLGKVKVKVGPVTTEYGGVATFVSKDDDAYRAVIDARGKESRGAGTASALISAHLHEDQGQTVVSVSTDLTITGKVAQFGRGMIQEISTRLIGQFADNLETMMGADTPVDAPAVDSPDTRAAALSDTRSTPPSREPEALDLLKVAGGSIYKRAAPVVVAAVLVVGVFLYLRKR